MSPKYNTDRLLAAWMDAEAPEAAPRDLVASITTAVAGTKRRGAWRVPSRWLGLLPPSPVPVRTLAAVALALVLAVAGLLVVGSRPRIPPPFGPARPGVFALSIGGDIITMAPDGSLQHALTTGDAWDSNPVFSRDGTRLAFWSQQAGSATSELIVLGADGSGRRVIARAEFPGSCAPTTTRGLPACRGHGDGPRISWSPDGASLAYSFDPGNQSQIYVARADSPGSAPVGSPTLKGQNPTWSPDGSLIAFSGGGYDDERGLYLMRVDGTDIRRLSTGAGMAGSFTAAWSPDGRSLVYGGNTGETTLFVINSDGSDEHQIDAGGFVGGASWSPDGTRMAWLHADRNLETPPAIYVAGADGRIVTAYPHEGLPRHGLAYDAYSQCVGWSVDGREVVGILTANGSAADALIEIDPITGRTNIIASAGLRAWNQQRLAP